MRNRNDAAGVANFNDAGAAGAALAPHMIANGLGMGREDVDGEGAEKKSANTRLNFPPS